MFRGPLFVFARNEVMNMSENSPYRFTDAEMETAKETDLPDLLEFNGCRAREPPTAQAKPAQTMKTPAFALPIPNQDQRRVFASKHGSYDMDGFGFKGDKYKATAR
jgi:hypothetical protein